MRRELLDARVPAGRRRLGPSAESGVDGRRSVSLWKVESKQAVHQIIKETGIRSASDQRVAGPIYIYSTQQTGNGISWTIATRRIYTRTNTARDVEDTAASDGHGYD